MSWSIYAKGSREAVKRAIETRDKSADKAQQEASCALIVAEIDAMPPNIKYVDIEAAGHCYANPQGEGDRTLTIKVVPLRLVE